jgi:beta-RFAP synthase
MNALRIRTASRLHFGLLGWGPGAVRQFGGVGLMIRAPSIEVVAEPAREWGYEGPLACRVRNLVSQILEHGARDTNGPIDLVPATLRVLASPAEHVGLGVGTQLSLAVVRLLWELAEHAPPSLESLARLSGRGRRSGVGLHGFLRGGLIVDGGRCAHDRPPPLVAHMPFPEDWSILIVQLPGPRGRHGPDEIQAFAQLPPMPDRVTDRLCRLVVLGILPAVAERDLSAFGDSLHELQVKVGEAFAPVQGGIYSSSRSEAIVDALGRLGLLGAGQTSWGPTLYAFGALSQSEQARVIVRIIDQFCVDPSTVSWTRAADHGALLERLST